MQRKTSEWLKMTIIRDLAKTPLTLLTRPYQRFREQRRFLEEVNQLQRQIKTQAAQELLDRHHEIWSSWDDAVDQVRNNIRKNPIQRKESLE